MAANLRVGIDGRGAAQGGKRVTDALGRIRRSAGETNKQLQKTNRGFLGLKKSALGLGAVLGGLSIGIVARELGGLSDEAVRIANRIKLVTDSTADLVAIQEKLFTVSQENRVGLGQTAELFQRVARSGEQLGISLNEVVEITDIVGKAVTISGVTADSANAALVQLGQGLASNRLSGDELRSVLEQTPRLARAIADGVGITIGELKKEGEAGLLTSQRVINALRSQAEVLKEEFKEVTPTIGQAFTTLRNSAIKATESINDQTGAGEGLARTIIDFGDWLGGPGTVKISQFIMGLQEIGGSFSDAGEIIGEFTDEFITDARILGLEGLKVADVFENVFSLLPLNVKTAVELAVVEITSFLKYMQLDWQRLVANVKGLKAQIFGDEEGVAAARASIVAIDAEILANAQARLGGIEGVLADRDAAIEKLKANRELRAAAGEGADLNKTGEDISVDPNAAKAALKLRKEMEKLAETLTERMQTPVEAFNANIAEMKSLFDADLISAETFKRGKEEQVEVLRKADDAFIAHNELLEEAAQLTKDVQTPFEEYTEKVENYQMLLEGLLITQETYNRAVLAAGEEMKDALNKNNDAAKFMEQTAIQAARNIQSAFADFLFDPFEDGLKGLASNFADTIKRMLSELIASAILNKLAELATAAAGGAGGGGFGGFVAAGVGAIAGGRQLGGSVEAGVPVEVGEAGREIFVPSTDGQVVPGTQSSGGNLAAAPEVNVPVQVVNVQDPNAIPEAIGTPAGQKSILNVIESNSDSIRRLLT